MFVGLMSGTSADGINAALVNFENGCELISKYYFPYPDQLKKNILNLYSPIPNEMNETAKLDIQLGEYFAQATLSLLFQSKVDSAQIHAIGSHGQTIRHNPYEPYAYSIQIANPNIIAARTGITTIADFRNKDLALGGQGAPLVPPFHHFLFKRRNPCAIVNIGGIANVTFLLNDDKVIGYDTGPGNCLLDNWIFLHQQKYFDHEGAWGNKGKIIEQLLHYFLEDPYFQQASPKSTGREYFNLSWLQQFSIEKYNPADIQATLTALTAKSIINEIKKIIHQGEIILCGGGIKNKKLMTLLRDYGKQFTLLTMEDLGLSSDYIEAMAFAWLAKQTIERKPGSIKEVTGASKNAILGGIYYA